MARYSDRLKLLDREFSDFLGDALDEQASKRYLVETAHAELKNAQEHNRSVLGYVPDHTAYVDGRANAPFESVRPDGIIRVEFELLDQMFKDIEALLITGSPVGDASDPRPRHPELYARSHVFLADRRLADPNGQVPLADEYVFINFQPYARKIERGLSSQARDGVYETTAILASNRYGNLASIEFRYRDLEVGMFPDFEAWAQGTKLQPQRRTLRGRQRDLWLRRQPSVVIRLR